MCIDAWPSVLHDSSPMLFVVTGSVYFEEHGCCEETAWLPLGNGGPLGKQHEPHYHFPGCLSADGPMVYLRCE